MNNPVHGDTAEEGGHVFGEWGVVSETFVFVGDDNHKENLHMEEFNEKDFQRGNSVDGDLYVGELE